MLTHNMTNAELNELLLLILQESMLDIEMESVHNNQPQSQREIGQQIGGLLYKTRLRIYEIAPDFPRIELDAIEYFLERGAYCEEPFSYHAVPQSMICNMNKAQVNAMLFAAYKAEYLLMRFPRPDKKYTLSQEELVEKTCLLHYNVEERLQKIVRNFPPIKIEAVVTFFQSTSEDGKPFAYF